MRFGLAGESDASDASSIYSYTSDESDLDGAARRYTEPVSHLGRRIRGFVDSSESESESDDDFGLLPRVHRQGSGQHGNDENSSPPSSTGRKGKGTASVWEDDAKGSHSRKWLKAAEEEAMRVGRKAASERRARLREIHQNARHAVTAARSEKNAQEEAEMARLLEGLVIQQAKKEEEMAQRFAEREKKLWQDIDAAIKQADKVEAQKKAAELAETKMKKEQAEAQAAAAEKEAQARRAQAEQLAREKVEKDRADAEARQKRLDDEAQMKAEEEARQKVADTRGRTSSEWRKWVERQRWMKTVIIEPVKADRPTRSGLRTSMRLITRNLGQVTNSKDTIVRVINDIHKLLVDQLANVPSPSSPSALDESISKGYAYLLSHLAKALIKQAESEVSAKAEAAFPLARVIVGLLLRGHGALSDVLFARFVKKCPWVVPFYPSKQPDQSREEYEKSTGRGSDESKTEYIARMAGITTLYFAILQTPLATIVPTLPTSPPSPTELPALVGEPLRFPAAWTWLANACRDPMPAMEPTAHLVTAWIETLGKAAIAVFGDKQVGKALDALYREGIEGGKIKGDSEAARQKLALVLQSWKSEGLAYPTARAWT